MKRYLVFLLSVLMLVGCVPAYFIQFDNQQPGFNQKCRIQVASYSPQPTFFLEPNVYPPVFTSTVMETAVSEENGEFVVFVAVFWVTRYTVIDGEYWFEVNIDGRRSSQYFLFTDDILTSVENGNFSNDDIVYKSDNFESDYVKGGRYWIPESVVISSPENLQLGLCHWHIQNDTFEELGIPQLSDCTVYPVDTSEPIAFRVGAGYHRSVRFQKETDFTYPVLGYADVFDARWYQVEVEGYAEPVWVEESDVKLLGRCDEIARVDSPPVIPNTNLSNDLGNCDTFRLLGLSGAVPDGDHTFIWTLVSDADAYIVNFYNYLDNLASSHRTTVPTLTVHVGSLETGSQLSLEVFAMRGDEILCGTGRSAIQQRLAEFVSQSEPPPEPEKEKKDKKKNNGYTPPGE